LTGSRTTHAEQPTLTHQRVEMADLERFREAKS